ncbi:MAG: 2-phospho-L-lactate guanylyltransferase [Betaproteobacteria bacterium]
MNRHRPVRAVVPVKRLSRSKGRLAPLLARAERVALARVMLEDVLSALRRAETLAGVIVITADDEVAAVARRTDADIMIEHQSHGMASAVIAAARHLQRRGDAAMLVVPADVPLVTAQDIETLIDTQHASPAVTLVPADRDGGTNMLLCSPPEAIPFQFGDDSFARHRQATRAAGVEPRVLRLKGAGLDLDRPEDIVEFLRTPSATRTHAWLASNGIPARLRVLRDGYACARGGPGTEQASFIP